MTALLLSRTILTPRSTIGILEIKGSFQCYVLEDVYRPPPAVKVPGATAIPCGTYAVRKTFSPRFKRDLYLVENVPGFSGIRFHAGNDPDDTEGCLLPGQAMGFDKVLRSRLALEALEAVLDASVDEITLTVRIAEHTINTQP